MFGLGYDVGSSSIKAALVGLHDHTVVHVVQFPETEMAIDSPSPGWAEQDPGTWWINLIEATRLLLKDQDSEVVDSIQGIGISYQMHGLVLLDAQGTVIRPSIIWCDSRAIQSGEEAAIQLGMDTCFERLLNLPGNFTASKFKWVSDIEPKNASQTEKILLPGDFLNYKLTGLINTTPGALSEGMLWDFKEGTSATFGLDAFGLNESMIPELVKTFSRHGKVLASVASELGIPADIPVCYRAGDQPNNAMSLGVLEAGEIAATGGTSGVIYGVMDQPISDTLSRVNCFAHVNYTKNIPMTGVLLCINGAGSMYRWVRQIAAEANTPYDEMERKAAQIQIGSDGLVVLPFGNGAERMLGNKDVGAHILNIDLNRHSQSHIYRATLEGIAFSFVYGIEVLLELGVNVNVIKAGNDNLFQSEIFSVIVATLGQCTIDLVETTGAIGAAKAVGFTLGLKDNLKDAMGGTGVEKSIVPKLDQYAALMEAYTRWKKELEQKLEQ